MKYDLSQIGSNNGTVNLLVEMASYIQEGKMSREQIPIDDVTSVVFELIEKKGYEDWKRNIILGAIDSVLYEIKETNPTNERIVKLRQQIIAYLL